MKVLLCISELQAYPCLAIGTYNVQRILQGQMEGFLKSILLSLVLGFREEHRAQYSLVRVKGVWVKTFGSFSIVGRVCWGKMGNRG